MHPNASTSAQTSLGEVKPSVARDPRDDARRYGIEFVESLAGRTFSAEFLSHIPIGFARAHHVIGLVGSSNDPEALTVAFASLASWDQLDGIARQLKYRVIPLMSRREAVMSAINQAYQQRTGQAQESIGKLDVTEILGELENAVSREDLLDVASRAPVIKVVNLLLFEAVKSLASDVHIEPAEDHVAVRMRIDGVLYHSFRLPKPYQEEIVSRVKIMGRMNIAEKRLPQDGRSTVQVGERLIDLRIASLPTCHGERIVIRLLDKSARLYQLTELGMPSVTLQQLQELIGREHGLLLVTGPTGSGKTTTLYSALKELDSNELNILTLEDPIEYQLEGIGQSQVSEKKGMTFASGLRSVLRQDPDVIMVGEIRDRDTATMAIQSALTGHLVFSTLHTNDAASSITRLLDLGVEPYLVSSSLIGVMAQRLVRQVCRTCAATSAPSASERMALELASADKILLKRGQGCVACRGTGYSGRLGIFELLPVSESLRHHIQIRSPASQIKASAVSSGMRTLRHDGLRKVTGGLTTVEEVQRVTTDDLDVRLDESHTNVSSATCIPEPISAPLDGLLSAHPSDRKSALKRQVY